VDAGRLQRYQGGRGGSGIVTQVPTRITWRDALIGILFALFAFAFQAQRRSDSYNGIFINGDAALYTAVAAARSNPQLFIGDTLLENPSNYNFYRPVHIPTIQTLGWVTGDYGKGLILLLGPLVWIHLIGYYLLGRVLYHNRFWALILSITTSVYILTPIGDDVGLMFDPLPGFAFGALLPYLLSVLIRYRDDTKKWIIIISCCAGFVYIHPVSAPAWVFGVWLSYVLSNPDKASLRHRVRRSFALGLAACCVALPFAVLYVSSHDHLPNDPVNIAAIRAAIEARVEPALFSPGSTIAEYSKWLLTDFHYTYFALLSVGLLWLSSKPDRRNTTVLITVITGVVAFTVLLPAAEYLATTSSEVPFQTDLVRPLKYVVPVIFILSVWGLCAAQRGLNRSIKSKHALSFIGLLVGVIFVICVHRKNSDVARFVYPTVRAWMHGKLLPQQPLTHLASLEAIRAVRDFTPEKSKVFVAAEFPLQVRYAALRPVVYAFKDGWFFTISNYAGLLRWHNTYKKLGEISETGYSASEVRQTVIPVAKELKADYILIHFNDSWAGGGSGSDDRVMSTSNAKLIRSDIGLGEFDRMTRQRVNIHFRGLADVWSNGQYGLFEIVK
jgi:hypothetical protein